MNRKQLTQLIENLNSKIQHSNFDKQNHLELFELSSRIEKEHPFIFSYLLDSLEAFLSALKHEKKEKAAILANVINARLKYLPNWFETKSNLTINLINENLIDLRFIKPFVRGTNTDYREFYLNQNKKLEEKLKYKKFNDNTDKDYEAIRLEKNINHTFRKTYAVHIVELMMGILKSVNLDNCLWVDIGCGIGQITNAVNSNIYSPTQWEIIGCDLQKSRISYANKNKTKNKNYFATDAFNYISKTKVNPNIISMFEFCEHFEDPAKLINNVSKLNPDVIILGTPLKQKISAAFDKKPDPAHLWGFTKESMTQIIKTQTNFNILATTENYVGLYGGGLDWLTVIAVSNSIHEKIKQNFVKPKK